jgi:cytochrome c-type biogenesis protein CcmH
MIKKLLLFIILGLTTAAWAAPSDLYSFTSPKQQTQFQRLTRDFRCVVCQNESLAESNAPIAKDLRFQIYQMVEQHKTNQEIIQYFVNRYGDFVLFKPPVSALTFVLWFAPFLMLVVALGRLFWLVKRRKQRESGPKTYRYTKEQRERIRHLLSEY